MSFSFLFSHDILYSAFFGKHDEFSLTCKESINKAFRLCLSYENNCCSIYSPSQSIDKIMNGFSSIDTKSKFENIFKRQGATQGVQDYSSDDDGTIKQSSRALSFDGRVIVISSKKFDVNPMVRFISPVEFIFAYNKAISFLDIFQEIEEFKAIDLIDLIAFIVFHQDAMERLNSIKSFSIE